MRLICLTVSARQKLTAAAQLAAEYEQRLKPYIDVATDIVPTEAKVLERAAAGGRTLPRLVLLDSRGKLLSSEQLAAWIGRERDSGTQQLIFAIGPADGWSEVARQRADLLLSFGPMTFPHELARVMLTEQLYRAFTILAGHPYHSGH